MAIVMDPPNEGQIIILERDEGAHRERIYIHPPDELNVIVVEENLKTRCFALIHWILKLFLPKGYPESVTKDYGPYQKFYNLQLFFGSIAGILTTQEILCSMGMSDGSVLAATITWIYKDVFGQIGKILFMASKGIMFDAYSKRWQIYADLINNVAMCFEMGLSAFGGWAVFVLCVTTMLKTIEGVSRTTRVALTGHHSVRGNLADVAAKSASQEIMIKLLSSVAAVFIMKYLAYNGVIFIVALCLHTLFNYLSVRAVCLNTLNEPRFIIAMHSYLSGEFIPRTVDVNRIEPLLQNHRLFTAEYLSSFKIKIGYSIEEAMRTNPRAYDLRTMERVYQNHTYILFPDMRHRVMYVMMKPGTFPNTTICAYLHALILSILICAINKRKLPIFQVASPNFINLYETIMTSNWPRAPVRYSTNNGFRYEPSERLHYFAQRVIEQEWSKFYSGLLRSGWVLHRHLFVTGEWLVGYEMDDDSMFDLESESLNSPVEFDSFEECLHLAIAYRNAELGIEPDAESIQEPVHQVHIVQPTIETEPQASAEEIRRRWIEDNEITHIGDCVIGTQSPPGRKRRPKKD